MLHMPTSLMIWPGLQCLALPQTCCKGEADCEGLCSGSTTKPNFTPKGPCNLYGTVHTLALKWFLYRYFGVYVYTRMILAPFGNMVFGILRPFTHFSAPRGVHPWMEPQGCIASMADRSESYIPLLVLGTSNPLTVAYLDPLGCVGLPWSGIGCGSNKALERIE